MAKIPRYYGSAKPTGGTTTRMVPEAQKTTRMVTRRFRKPKPTKAQLKAAMAAEKAKLAKAPRPKAKGKLVPPRERVKVLKGQVSLKARAGLFAQQQREQRLRSIATRKGRGRLKIPGQLKQYGDIAPGTILEERPVNSTWVKSIFLYMLGEQPALGVRFKRDDVAIVYTNTNLADFRQMALAASKGKFIWARLYHGIPGAGAPYKRV